jgi:transcriptional regulator with XRE-family HTH domain
MSPFDSQPAKSFNDRPESIGKRIARLRQALGWTQQSLSERLAISRVAISHIEMDLTIPSERTITLMAGLFKIAPDLLVAGTTYPEAKGERLPLVVCCYTELELELALLDNDIEWLFLLKGRSSFEYKELLAQVWAKWIQKLDNWRRNSLDNREVDSITAAQEKLAAVYSLGDTKSL